jgi:hypothetical protein
MYIQQSLGLPLKLKHKPTRLKGLKMGVVTTWLLSTE